MKKLIFLFTMLCTILLSACSDSESWNVEHGKEISKVYREPNLLMTLNGDTVKGKSAMFLTSDLTSAEIMIINTIPGEDSISFSNVKLTDTGKDNIYTFTDSTKNEDRKVIIEGQIGNGLTIKVKHEVTSKAVGWWAPDSGPIIFNIVPKTPEEKVFLNGFYQKKDTIYVVNPPGVKGDDFVTVIKNMGNFITLLILKLEMEMAASGDMTVYWKAPMIPQLDDGNTAPGMIRYNVYNNKIYPAIAIDDMLASASISDLASSTGLTIDEILLLLNLGQKAYKGLPLPMTLNEDGSKLKVTITQEMLLPYMETIVKLLVPMMENLDLSEAGAAGSLLGITNEGLVAFISELGRVVQESQHFEMYISLKRITKKSAAEAPMTREEIIKVLKEQNLEIQ